MNFCKAITTPRDDVSTHDYLYPIIKDTFKMTGGGNNDSEEGNGETEGEGATEKKGLFKRVKDKLKDKLKKDNNYYNNNAVEARAEARGKSRDKAYDIFVFVLGVILYILYLPIKPWLWISKEAFGSLQRLYSGTIVPL